MKQDYYLITYVSQSNLLNTNSTQHFHSTGSATLNWSGQNKTSGYKMVVQRLFFFCVFLVKLKI